MFLSLAPVVLFLTLFALLNPLFGWEGSPTKIDDRKKGTLIQTSLLEDLAPKASPNEKATHVGLAQQAQFTTGTLYVARAKRWRQCHT